MKVEEIVSIDFLTKSRTTRRVLPLLSILGIFLSLYCIFTVVPNERVMGAAQRIFYFHVGSIMGAYLMIAVLFFSSLAYLGSRKDEWDALAAGAASIALLFCTVGLATGMIWGHSAWNVWWRWEPRLVSFFVLWLILFSYSMLRGFSSGNASQKNYAAVLGIISAVNVPIVIYSIKLLDHTQQLHPEVVEKQGLKDPSYWYTFALTNVSLLLFALWLLSLATTALLLSRQTEELAAGE